MIERIGHGITILSILITWALEHAIETADSMKSRGYGLPGRTAFAIYRLEKRDKVLLALLCVLSVYMVFLALSGAMVWQYYPFIRGGALTPAGISGVLCYFILSILPTAIYKREEYLWRTIETDCPLQV
jgi:energy-coupling factor transport system permease protein